MSCALCQQFIVEFDAATKSFARAVAMMTASVGNADYHAAAKIADRLLVAASAASQRLTEHRTQSHNADWPAASQ